MSVPLPSLSVYSESETFDPRDLNRVKNDLEFVAKFIRQQRGNPDNSINQMVRPTTPMLINYTYYILVSLIGRWSH